jgi:hypothetical protein
MIRDVAGKKDRGRQGVSKPKPLDVTTENLVARTPDTRTTTTTRLSLGPMIRIHMRLYRLIPTLIAARARRRKIKRVRVVYTCYANDHWSSCPAQRSLLDILRTNAQMGEIFLYNWYNNSIEHICLLNTTQNYTASGDTGRYAKTSGIDGENLFSQDPGYQITYHTVIVMSIIQLLDTPCVRVSHSRC